MTQKKILYTEPAKLDCSVSLIARLHDILETGQYTNNKHTQHFEQAFKEHFNLKGECIAVNGCQNGLFLTLVALGIHRPILPDFTFCSTAHAAFYASRDFKTGDCDPGTWNLDLRGRNIAECDAIIGTHIFGCPCDHATLQDIANENGIPLIYDAAHAIGSNYRSIPIGDLGTASIFSLSPTKSLTAAEGGMIVTSNHCLAEKLKKLRNYGQDSQYDCKQEGMNGRMSEIHACFGLESLHNFDKNFSHKMTLVEEYHTNLPEEIFQKSNPDGTHSFKDLAILLGSKREKVERALAENQIEFRKYFRPISDLTCYSSWQVKQPNALKVYQSILQLPLHVQLEPEDVRRICRIVLSVLNESSAIDAMTKPVEVPERHHVIVSSEKG